jgi:hypothetical protein
MAENAGAFANDMEIWRSRCMFIRYWKMNRRFLRLSPAIVALCCFRLFAAPPQEKPDYESFGHVLRTEPADPRIQAALNEISADRVRHTIEKLVGFWNRSSLSSETPDLKPDTGVLAAADWIESELKTYSESCGGCLELKRDSFTAPVQARIPQPTKMVNVYGILRGSDPAQSSRMYLVTGHYDSFNSDWLHVHGAAPGANDDASGVAVSLECARVLSKLKFPATLVFAVVAGEEQGLIGSAHLAQLARQEGWDLDGVFDNDIVGGDNGPGGPKQDRVRVFSEGIPTNASLDQMKALERLGELSDSPSRELAREVCAVGATYGMPCGDENGFRPVLEFRRDRVLRGGDHLSFNKEGFAAVRFTEWREDFHHQHQDVRTENGIEYGDLLKFVDFNYVADVARLNAATLATMAAAPGEPRGVTIVTRGLENKSTLEWKPPQGAPPGTTYQILWRETTAARWQFFVEANQADERVTGSDHSATLPVSKDNVIFGLRSVDRAGHESIAVVPVPER